MRQLLMMIVLFSTLVSGVSADNFSAAEEPFMVPTWPFMRALVTHNG